MAERELELIFGPQHLGMIGNLSISLNVEGDTILSARVNPGYLHRGFEKLMEYRNWIQNFPLVCRINMIESEPVEMVYAMAVEDLAGIEVPERAQYIRTMIQEMSRLSCHFTAAWAYTSILGFDTPAQWAMGDRDYLLDLFEDLTGARVYHIYNMPGGVRRDLPEGFEDKLLAFLDAIHNRLPDYNSTFFENRLFYERASGIGKISPEDAIEMGGTGQVLRGCGIKHDIRKLEPYAAYSDMDFEVPTREAGDAYSRVLVIRDEMVQSVSILKQCIEKMPPGKVYEKTPNPFKWKVPKGETYVRVESARGEFGLYLVSNGGNRPYRAHFKTPSFVHGLVILERLLKGANIADVGNIMLSLYVIAPEIDR